MALASADIFLTYDSVGNKEEISDVISRIDPTEVPFQSMLRKEKAKTKKPEWQLDTLRAAANNHVLEGDEYAYTAHTPTTRVGNYCQISRNTVNVSGTEDVIDKAGRDSELAYQTVKAGLELRRDMEKILMDNVASNAGAEGTARRLGGFHAWLTTNADRGATGTDGGYNSGTGVVDVAVNGTLRDFTIDLVRAAQLSTYSAGARPTTMFFPPALKQTFSGFEGISELRTNIGNSKATVVDAVDFYLGDFGKLSCVVDLFQRTRDVYIVDPDYVSMATLRPMMRETPAKTGDVLRKVLLVEYTLKVENEKAHAGIHDLQ